MMLGYGALSLIDKWVVVRRSAGGYLLVLVAHRFACPVGKMRLGASRARYHFECIAIGRRIIREPCLHFAPGPRAAE
jgi:hypothetical protein